MLVMLRLNAYGRWIVARRNRLTLTNPIDPGISVLPHRFPIVAGLPFLFCAAAEVPKTRYKRYREKSQPARRCETDFVICLEEQTGSSPRVHVSDQRLNDSPLARIHTLKGVFFF